MIARSSFSLLLGAGLSLTATWLMAHDLSNDPQLDGRLASVRSDAAALDARVASEPHPAANASIEKAPHLLVWRGRIAGAAFESPVYSVEPFDRAVLSWNAKGSAKFELGVDGRWYTMGEWGNEPRSVPSPDVDEDTLKLATPAQSIQFRVTPQDGAEVDLAAVTFWRKGDHGKLSNERSPVWGKKPLDVPVRAQRDQRTCSPTSLSMVLDYYGFNKPTAEVAAGVFDAIGDHGHGVYGNWPFNTAYAYRVSGIESYVRRMDGLQDVEKMIGEGRPAIITVHGSPFSNEGHLIVVVGFDRRGDVIVNNPGRGVRRTYPRAVIHKAWMGREEGAGITYVLLGPSR